MQRAQVAFPDYHEELEEMIAEGDKLVMRLTITGTQLGRWGPLPLTGKPVRFEEIVILRFVDGKVVETTWSSRQPRRATPTRRRANATGNFELMACVVCSWSTLRTQVGHPRGSRSAITGSEQCRAP